MVIYGFRHSQMNFDLLDCINFPVNNVPHFVHYAKASFANYAEHFELALETPVLQKTVDLGKVALFFFDHQRHALALLLQLNYLTIWHCIEFALDFLLKLLEYFYLVINVLSIFVKDRSLDEGNSF
mmetsp:Transcript_34716/g.25860  ORF Transcript_34716/g.25860 Transcript_34716/m.25860 type:complete len:126 (-) Transcript_34716:179-556(-)